MRWGEQVCVETECQGWHQSGYEIEAYVADGKVVNQTGRVESGQSVLVAWLCWLLDSSARLNQSEQG